MRATVVMAFAAGLIWGPVAAQTTLPPVEERPAPETPPYDPTLFLESMVNYRTLAFTCEQTLPGSPVNDSAEIGRFFQTLGLPEPQGTDARLSRLVKRLVRSQGASICGERLADSAQIYGRRAVDYSVNKPEEWPEAPRISAGPWCASQSCSEIGF